MNVPPIRPTFSDGLQKPKRLSEVPGYLIRRVRGFFFRLGFLLRQVWDSSPGILLLMVFFCLCTGLLPVFGAYVARDLLNAVASLLGTSESPSFAVLRPVLTLLLFEFLYLFFSRVISRINNMVMGIAGDLVSNHIRVQIITKANSVDQSSFDRPEFYEKLENANREVGMRPIGILSSVLNVISTLISTISFIVILIGLHPLAPVVVALASVPGAIVNYKYRNRNFHYLRRHSKERRQMLYYSDLCVNKDNVKEIRLLGLGDTLLDKFRRVFAVYFTGQKKLAVKEGVAQILVGLFSLLAHTALFAFVAWRVIFGGGQIGDYSLFTGALSSISGYFSTLITSTAAIYEGTLFIDNLIAFLKEEPHILADRSPALLPARGCSHTLTFEHVSFSYPGCEKRVLKDISLTLKSGERNVLVGLNGAGKTTFIKLLTRLYDPTEGRILLDGEDVRSYDPRAYYDMFSIIFQDYGKYAEPVSENIRFGDVKRAPTKEAYDDALQSADAVNFVGSLPRGVDTPLTRLFEEDGIELSGGQWQRISLARAFYKKSDFLILDEPTAALDPMAEQAVFNRFYELSAGKMSIFVSHRLSSATTADRILVLEDGALVECGTHAELMDRGGKYYTLFTTQASRYVAAGGAEPRT